MEVIFDNKSNVFNARLQSSVPSAHGHQAGQHVFSLETTSGMMGRKVTTLKNERNNSLAVGFINWREKWFEVEGLRRSVDEVRRTEGLLKR